MGHSGSARASVLTCGAVACLACLHLFTVETSTYTNPLVGQKLGLTEIRERLYSVRVRARVTWCVVWKVRELALAQMYMYFIFHIQRT